MKTELTDKELWERFKEVVGRGRVAYQRFYAVPLVDLGSQIFGTADPYDLRALNRSLARALRRRGIRIVKRGHMRHALIPEDLLRRARAD